MESREWPLERLEREIGELAAHIHAATCRWLGLVAEYDRREGWAEWGCKSCAQWLSWRCALAPPAAREQVRVARRLLELPLIREAFGRGELSYSQVRALSRVATAELESSLLELARYATAAQLERTLRAYRGVVERELSPADAAHGERYLVCEHDDDGSLLIRGRLPAEEGALVLGALDAARDSLRGGPHAAQPSSEGRGLSAETERPLGEKAPPGCTQRRFLHAHHIDHWAHGGPTELANLVHLCRFHHRLVHEGGYTLERTPSPGELRFRRPDGRPLAALPDTRPLQAPGLERRNRRHGLQLKPDTCASHWMGDRLDLPPPSTPWSRQTYVSTDSCGA